MHAYSECRWACLGDGYKPLCRPCLSACTVLAHLPQRPCMRPQQPFQHTSTRPHSPSHLSLMTLMVLRPRALATWITAWGGRGQQHARSWHKTGTPWRTSATIGQASRNAWPPRRPLSLMHAVLHIPRQCPSHSRHPNSAHAYAPTLTCTCARTTSSLVLSFTLIVQDK